MTIPRRIRRVVILAVGWCGISCDARPTGIPAATQITIAVEPALAQSGAAFEQQPLIQIRDASAYPVALAGVVVTVAIASGGGTLVGTTSVATNARGVSQFTNLGISGTTGARVLSFSAPGLIAATSGVITLTPGQAVAIAILPSARSFTVGDVGRLAAAFMDAAGNTFPAPAVAWSTSDSSIAAIDTSGSVTAFAPGTATITALSQGIAARATLTITAAPVPLTFASVSVGGSHTCGVTTGGAAYCWGDNGYGQLGVGTTASSAVPVGVSGGHTFAQVSAGWVHTCGVTTDGIAYCWGAQNYGELGDGTTRQRTSPVRVRGGLTFKSVSVGDWDTCGVTTDGAAYCWGFGYYGQLGAGLSTATATDTGRGASDRGDACRSGQPAVCTIPTPVAGGLTFATVSAGQSVTCGVATTGATYCWGDNTFGELGTGSVTGPQGCAGDQIDWPPDPPVVACSMTPAAVASGLISQDVQAMSVSTCALGVDGRAFCWGSNWWGGGAGLLGTGATVGPETCLIGQNRSIAVSCGTAPLGVAGGLTFRQLSGGDLHSCGVTADGAAYCWGANDDGELGTGTTTSAAAPALVAGGLRFVSVIAGKSPYRGTTHTCGLTGGGTLYCWGANGSGQLGTGSTTPSLVPAKVAGQP